jgi:hypothetical protein
MKISEENKKKYFQNIEEKISKDGFHITSVLEEENFTPFSYSTGIFENYKIPELFISGLGPNLSKQLIDSYVNKFKYENIPLNEKIFDLTKRFSVYFIEVKNESLADYVLSSIRHYENKEFKYLQLIFPDLNGNFPNELNYNYDQEIIGKFEPI